MTENTEQTKTEGTTNRAEAPAAPRRAPAGDASATSDPNRARSARGGGGGGRRERGARRTRRQRPERARSEFDQKIIGIRRVTRVIAGGRRFSFSVALVSGNGRGQVGVGLGKATDTALAIEKASRDAKKQMLRLQLTDDASIRHETRAKYASSEVMMMPAPGKGLRAGSSVRTVLELGGVKNVSAKILSRSKNRINNARAAVEALRKAQA